MAGTSVRVGRAAALRGFPAAFSSAQGRRRLRSAVAARAAKSENPFVKIGTQLVKAGTGFTQTLTGTARVARRNVVDEKVVFVAGATGRLGARIVRECLGAGLTVRAGVRSKEKGEKALATAAEFGILTPDQLKRVQVVEYDLLDEATLAPALGNAGCVACAVGAPESALFDTGAPKRIDGEGVIRLVQAAKGAGVRRFVLVTSLGTTAFGWPASALNLFWGVLYWKAQAEKALIASGMAYTIVRPGGMERPADDYKETHNVVLGPRDRKFGGQVSRLQVAEVFAAALTNPAAAANKVLEVTAEESAPPATDLAALIAAVPQEITPEALAARMAEIGDARNAAELAATGAAEVEADLAEAEERKVIAERSFSEARSALQAARSEGQGEIKAADEADSTVERLEAQLEQAKRQEAAARAVLDAQRRAARAGEILSPQQIKEVTNAILNPEAQEQQSASPVAALGGLFGGAQKAAAKADEAKDEGMRKAKAAKPPARAPFGGLFGGGKQQEEEEEEEEEEETAPAPQAAKKKGGGGLFGGLFNQETAYIDEIGGEDEAPVTPPPAEVVDRAVTKRGRASVRDLVPRKSQQAGASKQASSSAPPAPEPKKAPPPPPKRRSGGGGGGGGLFGNLMPDGAKEAGAQAEKRAAAVATALGNLGAGSSPASNGNGKAPAAPPPPAPKAAAQTSAPAQSSKQAIASGNGVAKEQSAKAWIENWRAKQKVKA